MKNNPIYKTFIIFCACLMLLCATPLMACTSKVAGTVADIAFTGVDTTGFHVEKMPKAYNIERLRAIFAGNVLPDDNSSDLASIPPFIHKSLPELTIFPVTSSSLKTYPKVSPFPLSSRSPPV